MTRRPDSFRNQSVRDLAWAVGSAPLIRQPSIGQQITHDGNECMWPDSRWFRSLYRGSIELFERADASPDELDDLLAAQKDRRLGKYYETLWYYFFANHPGYEVLASNLQVIIDGRTLGEFDFIVLDKAAGRTIHVEVAVKFFLAAGDPERGGTRDMANWYGPNLRDRLDQKVDHLNQRQVRLASQPEVGEYLSTLGISIDGCMVFLKGRLFYPWQLRAYEGRLMDFAPSQCADDHPYSWWLSRDQFDEVCDETQCIMPLISRGWLERIPTASVKNSITKSALFETVSNKKMRLPLLVQSCNPCHSWDRAFLTANDWPAEEI